MKFLTSSYGSQLATSVILIIINTVMINGAPVKDRNGNGNENWK